MGNQKSETHDKFNNAPGVRQKYHFDDTAGLGLPRNFNLHDHHVEGPSKVRKNCSCTLTPINITISQKKNIYLQLSNVHKFDFM